MMDFTWGTATVFIFSIIGIIGALAIKIRDEILYMQLRKAARRPVKLTPPEPVQLTKGERHKEQQRLWQSAFDILSDV